MAEPLEKAWDEAWDTYVSAVRYGGTPEQRRWAFDHAMKALNRLVAQSVRDERIKKRKAAA